MTGLEWSLIGVAYVLISARATYSLWVYYLAVMALKRARDAGFLQDTPSKAVGSAVLVEGYLLDAYVNIFVLSFVLFEFPRELTVTSRLQRHNKAVGTWGKKVASWFEPLLDPHDPDGDHI